MTKEAVYVGVDVAKNSLDVAVSSSEGARQQYQKFCPYKRF